MEQGTARIGIVSVLLDDRGIEVAVVTYTSEKYLHLLSPLPFREVDILVG